MYTENISPIIAKDYQMSFLTMDHAALRLSVNSPERIKRDITDLQSQGRVLSKVVTERAQKLHLLAHIGMFASILLVVFYTVRLMLPEAESILISVILSIASTMTNKDELLDPIITKITRLLSRNELEEMDVLKSIIDQKAELLLKDSK